MPKAVIKSFASSDRFLSELRSGSLRPGYVLAGDEAFLYQRCRDGVLDALAPPDQRDFCLHDLDLGETAIFDVLDRAQTPSLMVPFQVIFVRGLKALVRTGVEEGGVCGDRRLLPAAESAGTDFVCGGSSFYSDRSSAHGYDRQGALRPHPRDAGRLVWVGGAGAG